MNASRLRWPRNLLLLAALAGFTVAAVSAQEGDTPVAPYPMLFPAGIDLPYDAAEPWDAPAAGSVTPANYTCATWENGGLELIRYRDELWIFFDPQGGPQGGQWVFCGIPLPYPYPSLSAERGEIGSDVNSDSDAISGSSGASSDASEAIPRSSSGPAGAPVIVGDFTIRALADLSVAELARAQEDRVIPHERLADGGYVLGFPAAPITIVVFSDYACPYCLVYEQEVIAQVVGIFVATGRARLEYRFFPTVDFRTGGYLSKLAACVGELAEERFWAGHAFLYARAGRAPPERRQYRAAAGRCDRAGFPGAAILHADGTAGGDRYQFRAARRRARDADDFIPLPGRWARHHASASGAFLRGPERHHQKGGAPLALPKK